MTPEDKVELMLDRTETAAIAAIVGLAGTWTRWSTPAVTIPAYALAIGRQFAEQMAALEEEMRK